MEPTGHYWFGLRDFLQHAGIPLVLVNPLHVFSVKQISPFSSPEIPIVIVGQAPLLAGLVRKQVPLLHPAA